LLYIHRYTLLAVVETTTHVVESETHIPICSQTMTIKGTQVIRIIARAIELLNSDTIG
jgi:hypothetical protein